jgi:V8-like Glu-specific endopeptidase
VGCDWPTGNRQRQSVHGDAYLPHLALTAGHCLLTPPRGKPDKAVALRFISRKGGWVYEIHGIEGRVDPA